MQIAVTSVGNEIFGHSEDRTVREADRRAANAVEAGLPRVDPPGSAP
jgi:hypothetical protein